MVNLWHTIHNILQDKTGKMTALYQIQQSRLLPFFWCIFWHDYLSFGVFDRIQQNTGDQFPTFCTFPMIFALFWYQLSNDVFS
jgi:hypothetical protein